MKQTHFLLALLCGAALSLTLSCSPKAHKLDVAQKTAAAPAPVAGNTVLDTFADLQILHYDLPGFDQLSLRQKTFIYYLSEATLAGRDIIYDQHCKYNLAVRKTLEGIFESYKGDRASADWKAFQTYAKRVWFSDGIHHQYNETKIVPGFSRNYFVTLVQNSDPKKLPLLAGEDANALIVKLTPVLFDPGFMAKRTNKDKTVDVVKTSAVNFYDGVTAAQVDAYYQKLLNAAGANPPSFGLNSRLVADKSGKLTEQVWKAGAGNLYGAAISKIVENLEKAIPFAENEQQKKAIRLLVEYYKSGDLAGKPDAYPEQLKFTKPWQPARIFFNTSWWFYGSREAFDKADKTNLYPLDLGVYLPLKGKSNTEIAAEARSMHRCQGFGAMSTRGESVDWFDFIKGERPPGQDPFAGINTTWTRVEGGEKIGQLLSKIDREYRSDNPAASVPDLLAAMQLIKALPDGHWKQVKLADIKEVIRGCLGLYLEATAAEPTATPGENIKIHLEAINPLS